MFDEIRLDTVDRGGPIARERFQIRLRPPCDCRQRVKSIDRSAATDSRKRPGERPGVCPASRDRASARSRRFGRYRRQQLREFASASQSLARTSAWLRAQRTSPTRSPDGLERTRTPSGRAECGERPRASESAQASNHLSMILDRTKKVPATATATTTPSLISDLLCLPCSEPKAPNGF